MEGSWNAACQDLHNTSMKTINAGALHRGPWRACEVVVPNYYYYYNIKHCTSEVFQSLQECNKRHEKAYLCPCPDFVHMSSVYQFFQGVVVGQTPILLVHISQHLIQVTHGDGLEAGVVSVELGMWKNRSGIFTEVVVERWNVVCFCCVCFEVVSDVFQSYGVNAVSNCTRKSSCQPVCFHRFTTSESFMINYWTYNDVNKE